MCGSAGRWMVVGSLGHSTRILCPGSGRAGALCGALPGRFAGCEALDKRAVGRFKFYGCGSIGTVIGKSPGPAERRQPDPCQPEPPVPSPALEAVPVSPHRKRGAHRLIQTLSAGRCAQGTPAASFPNSSGKYARTVVVRT
jgi:hypothetical protein